jgi:hypothetical protein
VPDPRRKRCKISKGGCGKQAHEVGLISWSGLCIECAKAKFHVNCDGIHEMKGAPALAWRRAVAASVGAVLLDDLPGGP